MTATATLLLVVGGGIVYVAWLLFIEYRTLKDDVPDNHITAVMRSAVKKEPWVFIGLALVSGLLCGHCFGQ